MSATLLTTLVLSFAPPPPPPEPEGEADSGDARAIEDGAEAPGETTEETPPVAPADEGVAGPEEIPVDERRDPILPYGEVEDSTEVEFADETPPPPELEYADPPPDDELEYDQTRQRVAPSDEALDRQADIADKPGRAQFEGRQASPQRFALEIKFGPYLPDVDKRWTGDGFGPYATIYGRTDDLGVTTSKPRKGLFPVFSFEWQFINLGGPFSIGTTVGWFRDQADALISEPVGADESVRSTADKTKFNVVPITVLLGYRFELLADRYRVPLVPYVRGGVGYGFWWERKGKSLATDSAGNKARGGSFGWQVNLGLMLRLDFIERASAVDLDRLTGINHTYVFGEWQFSHLDGFGSDKAMSVGDDTFLVGLAVEF